MASPYSHNIHASLRSMKVIVNDLHRVGKRSELKVKADALLKLTEAIHRNVLLLEITRGKEKLREEESK